MRQQFGTIPNCGTGRAWSLRGLIQCGKPVAWSDLDWGHVLKGTTRTVRELRILVIEDDPAIRQGVVDALLFDGYKVLEADHRDEGLRMATTVACDLVLLDLVLPGGDGLGILEEIRQVRPTLPVIVLTARGSESDRVGGLRLGADDYVVKPFSVEELLARVEAVLRRSPERPCDMAEVVIPGGRADLARSELQFDDGVRVALSQREIELLRYLAMNSGRVISRDEILGRVWQIEPHRVATRTIDMHIARLREKMRDNGTNPSVIRTVRGRGYLFSDGSVT